MYCLHPSHVPPVTRQLSSCAWKEVTDRLALLIFPPPRGRRRKGYDKRRERRKASLTPAIMEDSTREMRGGGHGLGETVKGRRRGYANVTSNDGRPKKEMVGKKLTHEE
jgi:hypothetical protein